MPPSSDVRFQGTVDRAGSPRRRVEQMGWHGHPHGSVNPRALSCPATHGMLDVNVNVKEPRSMTSVASGAEEAVSGPAPASDQQEWSISSLAADLQVTSRTLRFYEAEGLIEPIRGPG